MRVLFVLLVCAIWVVAAAVSRGPNSNEGMDKHALLQRTQQEIADLGSRLSDLSKSGDTKQIDQIRRRLEEKNSLYDKIYTELKSSGTLFKRVPHAGSNSDSRVDPMSYQRSPLTDEEATLLARREKEIQEISRELEKQRTSGGNENHIKSLTKLVADRQRDLDETRRRINEDKVRSARYGPRDFDSSYNNNRRGLQQQQQQQQPRQPKEQIPPEMRPHPRFGTQLNADMQKYSAEASPYLEADPAVHEYAQRVHGSGKNANTNINKAAEDATPNNIFAYMSDKNRVASLNAKKLREMKQSKVVEDVVRLRNELEDLQTQYSHIQGPEQHALANELRMKMDQRLEEHNALIRANPSLAKAINDMQEDDARASKYRQQRIMDAILTRTRTTTSQSRGASAARSQQQQQSDMPTAHTAISTAQMQYFASRKQQIENTANHLYTLVYRLPVKDEAEQPQQQENVKEKAATPESADIHRDLNHAKSNRNNNNLNVNSDPRPRIDAKTRTQLLDDVVTMMQLELDVLFEEVDIEDQAAALRGINVVDEDFDTFNSNSGGPGTAARKNKPILSNVLKSRNSASSASPRADTLTSAYANTRTNPETGEFEMMASEFEDRIQALKFKKDTHEEFKDESLQRADALKKKIEKVVYFIPGQQPEQEQQEEEEVMEEEEE